MRDALSAPGVERRPEPGSAAAGAGARSRGGRVARGELSGGATIWIPGGSLKAVRLGWWNSSARAAVEAARALRYPRADVAKAAISLRILVPVSLLEIGRRTRSPLRVARSARREISAWCCRVSSVWISGCKYMSVSFGSDRLQRSLLNGGRNARRDTLAGDGHRRSAPAARGRERSANRRRTDTDRAGTARRRPLRHSRGHGRRRGTRRYP